MSFLTDFFYCKCCAYHTRVGAVPEGTREGADTTAEIQFVASGIGMKEGARREGVKSVKESAG